LTGSGLTGTIIGRGRGRRSLAAIGAIAWSLASSNALAHLAQARSAAFSSSGTAVAISLPGFGVAVRPDADRPFSYVCDALLEATPSPSDTAFPMAFTDGGTLLIGTGSGLRALADDGCPDGSFGGELRRLPVVALAVHPRSTSLAYAVVQREGWHVARSEDAGRTWEIRSRLPTDEPVSALVLDVTETSTVYVSQTLRPRSIVLVSTDAALSFSTLAQDAPRVLLDVEPTSDDGRRFWAVGRPAGAISNRGFELLAAAAPQGPWTSMFQVNYFGGFAIEPSGAIWIGDESGGVYRSSNGGLSFDNVGPTIPIAHLSYAQDAIWACMPGLPTERAFARWSPARSAFEDVLALGAITRMVDCAPEVNAQTICAAAWAEWQRDILMSASSPGDAGTAVDAAADAGLHEDPASQPDSRPTSSGCALSGHADSSGSGGSAFWLLFAMSFAIRSSGSSIRRSFAGRG
jgi:hypothetical protein